MERWILPRVHKAQQFLGSFEGQYSGLTRIWHGKMVLILSRGTRTSMIIDPPDGRIPPLTPEAEKTIAAKKEYLEALLQGTSGGRPGPISPRRSERPPDYNLDRMNRSDGPEDRGGPERCFGSNLPILAQSGTFSGVARIVQTPTAVGITILPCRDTIDAGRRQRCPTVYRPC